jgi:hypothetical protein
MIIVAHTSSEPDIRDAQFCCDLAACKGGCCTLEGGRGAPLADEEVEQIKKALPLVEPYLTKDQLATIAAVGPVEGKPGDFATPCLNERECVYVYFDGPIARCSFERAYLEGRNTWRKPLSCHLYPIRIRSVGKDYLRYDRIEECESGRRKGRNDNILLRNFLREPLVRKYGEEWYREFTERCDNGHADDPGRRDAV